MQEITQTQKEVLLVISEFISKNKYSPTIAEIARLMGYKSTNAAYAQVSVLSRKRFIDKKGSISRGILLTSKGRKALAS